VSEQGAQSAIDFVSDCEIGSNVEIFTLTASQTWLDTIKDRLLNGISNQQITVYYLQKIGTTNDDGNAPTLKSISEDSM
jgi:hypothetical protein